MCSSDLTPLSAQTSNVPYAWTPFLSRRLQTPIGGGVYNNLLWVAGANADKFGITAFDGNANYQGGKTLGMGVDTFHSTGSGLYITVYCNRAIVQPQAVTGTFQTGEWLTQRSSGARGVLVHSLPDKAIILTTIGKFNTTPITGETSQIGRAHV